MFFNSFPFVLFFIAFYLVYNAVKGHQARLWVICLFSLFFYGAWNYKFVPLLVGTGLLDYAIARAIARSDDERRRHRLVTLSVTMNLVVLGFFKYANFFLDNSQQLLRLFGLHVSFPMMSIVLPLGISFYTFQSISFTVDVYRRVYEPPRHPLPFLASLVFFPHLLAGPIVRASYLVPQFERLARPRWDVVRRSFVLIGLGLLKKTVADLLAPSAQALFESGGAHSALVCWTGVLAFAGQVYGDFAGYTDIAIGLAGIVGFELPGNFDLPFFATSPIAFWSRWHISLTDWIRDYIYFPLQRKMANAFLPIVITMLLAGLWHGASWNMVLFGVYHGVLLAVTHWIGQRVPDAWAGDGENRAIRALKIACNFYLVLLGYVMFRAHSIPEAFTIIREMHAPVLASTWDGDSRTVLVLVVLGLMMGHVVDYVYRRRREWLERSYLMWPLTVSGFAISIALPIGVSFFYFQF